MASVIARTDKAGHVCGCQVWWREDGSASGEWRNERFGDEGSAGVFRNAVGATGQTWLLGWVKGKGSMDEEAADELRHHFDHFAQASVENAADGPGGARDQPCHGRWWSIAETPSSLGS
ncbi:hypothetical protein [Streptomyces colonosanans]|uniref:hypothetical protein n=1 Tax=Streptomyces colonosanans TaxID=1428652 RepID=UPI00115F8DA0|nr:hypothetical protein [Streptomyces colonosanans]